MKRLVKSSTDEQGGVLVYALMGITLLATLVFTAYVVAGQSVSNAVFAQMNAQSRYTAEAGMEKAIRQLLNESNKVQALNEAINTNQGVWIPEETLAISEVGYTTKYIVKVAKEASPRAFEFISMAYTNGSRSVEVELIKRISFGYQPFSYASSPLFEFSILSPGGLQSDRDSEIEITGGNFLLGGDLATKGDLQLTDLTFCILGANRLDTKIEQENVIEDCSFPILDVEEEMAKLYNELFELSATRDDIYVTDDNNFTIRKNDIEDGKWVKDGISYSVIIAPSIRILGGEEFGTEESPFLLFAGTEKGGKFEPGVIFIEEKLELNGFILGERIQKNRGPDLEFEINGGIIMTERIDLYDGADIKYPELTGGSFSEVYINYITNN
jgi:hypothetical protein